MILRPGVNLMRGLSGLVIASPLAFIWTPVVFILVAASTALLIAAIVDASRLRLIIDHISVRRLMPSVVGRDALLECELTVVNRHSRPVHGELRDEHPPSATPRLVVFGLTISAGGMVWCKTTCRLSQRGLAQFGPTWIRLYGPWRLVEGHRSFDCVGQVKVLPETFASREHLSQDLGAQLRMLDKVQRSRQRGTGTEFESLHQFRDGDDPRRIDWRATARRQTLVVRRFQIERHRDVMVIVDSGRLMGANAGRGSKLDCAIDASLNLARVVLDGGDRCGAAAFDRQVRGFLPPLAGTRALRSIVECFYDVEVQWHESDFTPMLAELRVRRAKRTFLIVLSDVSDPETSQRLSASLRQLQQQHIVLLAALRTPLLTEIVADRVENVGDAARKVAAMRLLRDRRRALHALRRGGVHVLDVEPQQLTLPLVNQFVELRQRNLL